MIRSEIPALCGELQGVIAKCRQEEYTLTLAAVPHEHGPANLPSRGLFCVREPGLFVDVLEIHKLKELRQAAFHLTAGACRVRDKLRMLQYASSTKGQQQLDYAEVLKPLFDIVESPATTATSTGEALSVIQRVLSRLVSICDDSDRSKMARVVNATVASVVKCVFRQTESGDDEIAVMWALEVLETCSATDLSGYITEVHMENILVTVYKNCVASSNADMLRKLALRKLGTIVKRLFVRVFTTQNAVQRTAHEERLACDLFRFLCHRIDPRGVNWHDMESRQTCLELILVAFDCTIECKDDCEPELMLIECKTICELICNDLFRALLQTCQAAGKVVDGPQVFGEGHDLIKMTEEEEVVKPDEKDVSPTDTAATKPPSEKKPQEEEQAAVVDQGPRISSTSIVSVDSKVSGSRPRQREHHQNTFSKIPITFNGVEKQYHLSATRHSVSTEEDATGGSNDLVVVNAFYGSNFQAIPASNGGSIRVPLAVLSRSLRLIHTLVSHLNSRKRLKVQTQALYNSVFLRALESSKMKQVDKEARRLVLETLTDLFADPTVAVDLYVNYDCSLNSTNVYEDLFVYLSNHSFPKQLRKLALDSLQLMSLRCIHLGVAAISNRIPRGAEQAEITIPDGVTPPSDLVKAKLAKRQLVMCAAEFNRKPKAGVSALTDGGIISTPPDPAQIAAFLRTTHCLDKSAIGEFIGGNGELNTQVLKAFVATFKMQELTLLEGLRMFLESFRLPGEAQMIDRILQCFSEAAYEACIDSSKFPSVDCTYLLAFSIILLNTDLHNPNIRPEKKMSFNAFKMNNLNYGQEVSKGQDMPVELLRSIYDEIKSREINTMSDGSSLTAEITTDRWRDMLRGKGEIAKLIGCHPENPTIYGIYDKEMFSIMHKSAFAALSVVYQAGDPTKQPRAVDLALEGIMSCAKVASHFHMIGVLDRITVDVCKFTSLLLYARATLLEGDDDDADDLTDDGYDIDDEDDGTDTSLIVEAGSSAPDVSSSKDSVGSSPSSGKARLTKRETTPDLLGSENSILRAYRALLANSKAQTATRSVFEITLRYGNMVRQAWPQVLYCLLRLFDLQLLPGELLKETPDPFVDHESRVQYHKMISTTWLKECQSRLSAAREKLERSTGWVSWFSGESRQDAERAVGQLEEEVFTVKNTIAFVSKSVSVGEQDPETLSPEEVKLKERTQIVRLANFVAHTAQFSDLTLVAFIRGIVHSCGGDESRCPKESELLHGDCSPKAEEEDDVRGDLRIDMLSPPSKASRMFGLHLMTEVALKNVDRVHLIWPMIRSHMIKILRSTKLTSCRVEEASMGLLRVSIRLLFSDSVDTNEEVCSTLKLLLRMPREQSPGLDAMVCKTLLKVFDSRIEKEEAEEGTVVNSDAVKGIWNLAVSRILIVISQLEDYQVSCQGVQILRKVFSHPALIFIPTSELLSVCQVYFARSRQHLKFAQSNKQYDQEESCETLVDIINLLFVLHSRLLMNLNTGSSELTFEGGDLLVLVELANIANNPENPGQARVHSINLLKEAILELHAQGDRTQEEWALICERALLRVPGTTPSLGDTSKALLEMKSPIDNQDTKLVCGVLASLLSSVSDSFGQNDELRGCVDSYTAKFGSAPTPAPVAAPTSPETQAPERADIVETQENTEELSNESPSIEEGPKSTRSESVASDTVGHAMEENTATLAPSDEAFDEQDVSKVPEELATDSAVDEQVATQEPEVTTT